MVKDKDRQGYYCVIPWKLLTDKAIPSSAKLIYGEISALANREGFCWASNEHFGKTFGLKANTTISRLINLLKDANYIYVDIDRKAGNKRRIYLQGPIIKKKDRYPQKSREGIIKNRDKDNHIDNQIEKKNILKRKKHSSIKDIGEEDLVEISEKYHVSLGFVKLKLETLVNYCESKGKRYKNYKSALRNFVLSDMQRQIERKQNDKYAPIDARHVK